MYLFILLKRVHSASGKYYYEIFRFYYDYEACKCYIVKKNNKKSETAAN